MIGYVTLGTNDLDRGARFYDALRAEIGAKRMMTTERFVVWFSKDGESGIDSDHAFGYTRAMVRTAFILLILMVPVIVHAHPGKTDRYGGHKCLKKCEDWGLVFDEYHLHDKEGRPVRVAQKREILPEPAGPVEPAAEPMPITPEQDPVQQQPAQETITVHRHVTVIEEESIIPRSPLVFVLLVLLALLLILRLGNDRKEKK